MSITRTTLRRMSFLSLVLVFLLILSTEAQADLYGFEAVSWNSPAADAMAAQLSLELVDLGIANPGDPYQVEFIFKNNIAPYTATDPLDPVLGIITGLAFEDGALFDMGVINHYPDPLDSGSVVSFVEDPTPPTGTWGLGFDTTHFFRADATPPPPTDGVNPYEAVGIEFDLIAGKTYQHVIDAINQGFTGPIVIGESLRIGIHVQNLDPDGDRSDAYIMTPIPASVVLGMLGLGVAGLKLRKFA
ncbi:MAG: hypothetical protein ABIL62_08340 [Planctomycetota bacterium]